MLVPEIHDTNSDPFFYIFLLKSGTFVLWRSRLCNAWSWSFVNLRSNFLFCRYHVWRDIWPGGNCTQSGVEGSLDQKRNEIIERNSFTSSNWRFHRGYQGYEIGVVSIHGTPVPSSEIPIFDQENTIFGTPCTLYWKCTV